MQGSVLDLLVLGCGGFAQEAADIARASGRYRVQAFVEGLDRSKCGGELDGLPILWVEALGAHAKGCHLICAVGSTKRRGFIGQAAVSGLPFATLIHPDASVSATARIAPGAIVGARVVVSSHSQIGEHTIINRGVLIGHHSQIGKINTISPGVNLGGFTETGDEVFIGMGAIVLDHLKIGAESVVSAGALLRENVSPGALVAGSPAKVLKRSEG